MLSSKSKRVLDIGSGPGFFLKRAKRRGWDVLGIEPSLAACNYSKKHNIPTIQKFFYEVDIKQIGKFDAIHIFDVLEHVNDPISILKKSYSLLKRGGIIVVEVPNDFNPLQKLAQKKHLRKRNGGLHFRPFLVKNFKHSFNILIILISQVFLIC